jgi:adenylate cyclase
VISSYDFDPHGLSIVKDRLLGKLAVILHADVAGSTQLVQQDEQLAHERIQDVFRRFGDTISKYYGQVRELRGDALLAEFERASDAVTAALAFQAEQSHYIAQLNDQLQPTVRVGIAMGEVVIADNTITGTGVVLAQRLEQLSEPGGVVIQGAAYETIPGRFPFEFVNLGEHEAKGFEEPVRVFSANLKTDTEIPLPDSVTHKTRNTVIAFVLLAVVIVGVALMWVKPWEIREEPASLERMPFPLPSKPSIAVLAFDNLSNDPNQEYFSDGIAEDIITDLSQLKNLAVIARNSSFTYKGTSTKVQDIGKDLGVKYLLEGSLRKAGNKIRISVQLIDTASGHHLWAERFDRELTDMFYLQDEITQRIVSSLSIQLSGGEQQQLAHTPTNSFEAYDLFLQGQMFGTRYTEEGLAQAAELYRQAIILDPDFTRAYGALATALIRLVFAGYSDSPVQMKERALELALKAVSMKPNSPQAQWALGYVYMYRNRLDDAVKALEHAISLSPSYADSYALLALIKNNQGHAAEAIRLIETGMSLNPHFSWDYLYNLGRADYALGNYQQAAEYLKQALERNGTASGPRLFLIASYVELGQHDDAEWEVMQLEISNPNATLLQLPQILPISDAVLRDKLIDDLKVAGLAD